MRRGGRLALLALLLALPLAGCGEDEERAARTDTAGPAAAATEAASAGPREAPRDGTPAKGASEKPRSLDASDIRLPEGYQIAPVAHGLSYVTSLAFDDEGNMYVGEAGGHTYGTKPEEAPPPRILRFPADGGDAEVLIDEAPSLAAIREAPANGLPPGLIAPITGLTWHDGKLYVSHRTRVSTVDPETGELETIVEGLPAWGEFQNNKPIFGPDGKMYFFVSTQGNSGPVGDHMLKVLKVYNKPNQHEVPCEDIELTGVNFTHPNPFTPAPDDKANYDAYVPFGKNVPPGTRIKGQIPCNGAFFRANPDGSALELVAWGLRSDFGYRFNSEGELIASQNSGNPIPPRSIFDDSETIWRVEEGKWYGWPDYWSGLPVTDERFRAPSGSTVKRAPERHAFILTEKTRRRLLGGSISPPQPLVKLRPHVAAEGFVFGRDEFGVPQSDILLAEFGTVVTYQAKELPGFRVERVNLTNGQTSDFAVNRSGKPQSVNDSGGLERPIQLEYGPEGALFIVDFGVIDVDASGLTAIPNTGVIWRVTREQG